MKKLSILGLILFVAISVNAQQKKQNVYFFKDSGKEVFIRDSADFIRVVQEPDSGETYYGLREFYKEGSDKLIGKVSSFSPRLIYEGTIIKYNKKGKKVSAIAYKKGELFGPAYYFYDNGKVKKHIEYLTKDKTKKGIGQEFKMVYFADSLGTAMVTDGNGHAVESTNSKDDVFIEEGDYKEGFKEGIWTGKYQSGKSSYTETYELSKLVSGVNTVGDKKYEYTQLEVPPEFKGGIQQFYRYLASSINYPRDAMERGLTGSVIVSFMIEKDGQIVDAKVDRPVMPSMDREALRVVLASPKWMPGIQRGVPVRVKYNIPISFKTTR